MAESKIEITARDDSPDQGGCEVPPEVLHFRDHEFGKLAQRFFSHNLKLPPGSVDFYNSFAKIANDDAVLEGFARVFTMKKLPEKLRLFRGRKPILSSPKEPGYIDMFEEVMALRPPSCVWSTLKNICSKIGESIQNEPAEKESTPKESTQKEPTAQEGGKQNGPTKGEPKDGAGLSSQVYDDFVETSKWLVALMKQGDMLASTETVADYSRFKRGFERFDTLLEKLAEGVMLV
ncbi:hypothetical protein GQ607_001456 [Colletotrichum asianum]|uniref:Uncharacterized protein n=1 Tax=Colletotrichum asianum TaxID=702518 RepID=A0A8H3ZTD4_9PEZI|nr:hypothetical protein GQ607_001456 [Colletotrichum asianum]